MELLTLKKGDAVFANMTPDEARARGFSDAEITAATEGAKWDAVRAKRDQLLTACDWTQMPDSPLGDAQKAEWATYRQALRDIPQDAGDPVAVVWPTEPTVA